MPRKTAACLHEGDYHAVAALKLAKLPAPKQSREGVNLEQQNDAVNESMNEHIAMGNSLTNKYLAAFDSGVNNVS